MAARNQEDEEEEIRTAIDIVPVANRFDFTPIPCPVMDDIKREFPDTMALLDEWGLNKIMKIKDYTYDKSFQPYQKEGFILSFFLCRAVKPTLLEFSGIDMMESAHRIDSCNIEDLSCTVKNMEFFDPLWTSGIVRRDGEMIKAEHDTWGSVPLKDEVRKMMISRYTDYGDLFSNDDKKEFIFRILKYILVCGDPEKFENDIGPYLHTARILYKHLVSVSKDQNTGVISIDSLVYKVEAYMGSFMCFPHATGSNQWFCFFIIDNRKKRLRLWHSFIP